MRACVRACLCPLIRSPPSHLAVQVELVRHERDHGHHGAQDDLRVRVKSERVTMCESVRVEGERVRVEGESVRVEGERVRVRE